MIKSCTACQGRGSAMDGGYMCVKCPKCHGKGYCIDSTQLYENEAEIVLKKPRGRPPKKSDAL